LDGKVLTERQTLRLTLEESDLTLAMTLVSVERQDPDITPVDSEIATRRREGKRHEEAGENDSAKVDPRLNRLAEAVKEVRRKEALRKRASSFGFSSSAEARRGLVVVTTIIDFDTRNEAQIKLLNSTTPVPKTLKGGNGGRHGNDDGHGSDGSAWGAGQIDLSSRVGGMDKQINEIFRRVFASRDLHPDVVTKLKIRHTRGMILYGPPGTGKTLIATVLAEQLNAHKPLILSGPEVFGKFVGESGERIRKLFEPAETEWQNKGNASQLHVIIIDEIDAMCKNRSSQSGDAGSNDQVVNQLLAKMDGVNSLNNVLMIGMTNRLEEIDRALLRPGRFEVKVLIGIPDEKGRGQILKIHTNDWTKNGSLHEDVSLAELASKTKNFTGAELKGLCNAALSHALMRISRRSASEVEKKEDKSVDPRTVKPVVRMKDFLLALTEVHPMYGAKESDLRDLTRGWIGEEISSEHKSMHASLRRAVERQRRTFEGAGSGLSMLSILLEGPRGSGKTAVAAYVALRSGFPFARVVSFARDFAGLHEHQQAQHLREVFEEAYKSKWSAIILDDVEHLVHLSCVVGSSVQYSNTLLLTLASLVRSNPPAGHRLCVIGTTSQIKILRALQVTDAFQSTVRVPRLRDPTAVRTLMRKRLPRLREKVATEIATEVCRSGGIGVKRMLRSLEKMRLDNEIPSLEKWHEVFAPDRGRQQRKISDSEKRPRPALPPRE